MRWKNCFAIIVIGFCCIMRSACADIINTKNGIISYQESGQGKPLVLIHAFPTDKRLWTVQHEGLKSQFRVISLDLWGFGESSPASSEGQAVLMTDYADEVKQLLDHLQIEQAIIGGESMGGYIALAFLERYPNHVSGLVLSNTQAIADSTETRVAREKTALDVLEHGTEQLVRTFSQKALSSQATEKLKEELVQILSAQKPAAIASALRGMALRSETKELLTNTSKQILIITSHEDIVVPPQQSEEMHRLAKNSQLIHLENAGHLSNLEQEQQWNQAVINQFSGK